MSTELGFTASDVLAWARTKPSDASYDYRSNDNCAICQFLRETGRCDRPSAGDKYWRDTSLGYHENAFPEGIWLALLAGTFGGLAERLAALEPTAIITSSDWAHIDAYLVDDQVSA